MTVVQKSGRSQERNAVGCGSHMISVLSPLSWCRHSHDDVIVWGGACVRVPAFAQKDGALPLLPAILRRRLHARRLPPAAVREEPGQEDEPRTRPRHLHPRTRHPAWVQQAELHGRCWRCTCSVDIAEHWPLHGKQNDEQAAWKAIHQTLCQSVLVLPD